MEQGAAEKDGDERWSQTSQERIQEYERNADDKSLKRELHY
jgi:hypothetical protein